MPVSRRRSFNWTDAAGRAVALAATSAVAAAGIGYRARHEAPYTAVLEQVEIPVPHFGGIPARPRIGFVADIHIGPVIRPADVDRSLALLLSADPDLLLFGGDYVCESPRHIPDAAAVLGDYASATRFGALAVLGNHDYSNDAPRIITQFERRGIQVLRNDSVRVEDHSGGLWIAGIDDALLGSPDPGRAFAGLPAGAESIVLWHEPDWAEHVVRHGPLMQLSGHSHGGQVRLPALGAIAAPHGGRRYVAGLNYVAGMPIYTSRGVGVFRPPVRVLCPPEVTLITLV